MWFAAAGALALGACLECHKKVLVVCAEDFLRSLQGVFARPAKEKLGVSLAGHLRAMCTTERQAASQQREQAGGALGASCSEAIGASWLAARLRVVVQSLDVGEELRAPGEEGGLRKLGWPATYPDGQGGAGKLGGGPASVRAGWVLPRLVELLVGEPQSRLAEEVLTVEVRAAAVGRCRALPARWVGGERRGGCGGGAHVPELSIKDG